MKNRVIKIVSGLLAVIVAMLAILPATVTQAKVPYKTYTQDGYNRYVETQTSYTPVTTITKIVVGSEQEADIELKKPQDIKITDDGFIYIADTGEDRIVVATLDGKFVKSFGDDILKNPVGIFVDANKNVYVADSEHKNKREGAILVFDKDGNLINQYNKPESQLYGSAPFQPQKIAVDKRGNMYITTSGNTNGIVQITPTDGGTFLGYFGTNKTEVTPLQMFLNLILSDEQKAKDNALLPMSVTNLSIDEKNLIYTLVASTGSSEPLRKLNVAGKNLMTVDVPPENGISLSSGKYENVFVASTDGIIYEYSKEGSMLFRFGGSDDSSEYRVGLFNMIAAIDVDANDNIYVLDSGMNQIQIFEPTEFTNLVHKSLELYQRGLYSESMEYLEEVIKMNSLFDYANQAMGQALYQEMRFEESIKYYRLAKDTIGYSEAFWELRNEWLNENIINSMGIIVGLIILSKVLKAFDRKKGIFNPIRKATKGFREAKLFRQITHGFYYMKHPLDGAYAVKRQGMKSFKATAFLMFVIIIFDLVNRYFGGFLVKTVRDGEYNIPTDVFFIIFAFTFAAAVTYLICTINDGESRFTELYAGFVYSFTPYLVIQPMIYLFGNVVTFNEMFIIDFANTIMMVWIATLLFLTIKEINNYSVKETVKVIAISVFAAVIFALIAFIVYVLAAQVVTFVTSIYGEVVYRIGN